MSPNYVLVFITRQIPSQLVTDTFLNLQNGAIFIDWSFLIQ